MACLPSPFRVGPLPSDFRVSLRKTEKSLRGSVTHFLTTAPAMVEAHIVPSAATAELEMALSLLAVVLCVIIGGLMSGLTVGLLSLDPLNLKVRGARPARAPHAASRHVVRAWPAVPHGVAEHEARARMPRRALLRADTAGALRARAVAPCGHRPFACPRADR